MFSLTTPEQSNERSEKDDPKGHYAVQSRRIALSAMLEGVEAGHDVAPAIDLSVSAIASPVLVRSAGSLVPKPNSTVISAKRSLC